MSAHVTIEEAQAHLPELIAELAPGKEVVITQNEQPVAKLVSERPAARQPRNRELCGGPCCTWHPILTYH